MQGATVDRVSQEHPYNLREGEEEAGVEFWGKGIIEETEGKDERVPDSELDGLPHTRVSHMHFQQWDMACTSMNGCKAHNLGHCSFCLYILVELYQFFSWRAVED